MATITYRKGSRTFKIELIRAKSFLGFPDEFNPETLDDWKSMLGRCKEKTVEARKANDTETEIQCNRIKAFLVKRSKLADNKCVRCGKPRKPSAVHCQVCNWALRKKLTHALPENKPSNGYQIESGKIIPPPKSVGRLTETLMSMKVGQSFVFKGKHDTPRKQAWRLGIKISMRILNPEEKDSSNHLHRVWRTDGLSNSELNKLIQTTCQTTTK